MVRVIGLEPIRFLVRGILSPLRLPFRHTHIKMESAVGFEPTTLDVYSITLTIELHTYITYILSR